MEKLEFAKMIVKEAGEIIRLKLGEKLKIMTKTSRTDFVTNVDTEIEIFLVNEIQKQFPGQSFLTEEKTIRSDINDTLWIIDPIDGTTNFIMQQKNFAISLAYYERQQPVFGIVYDVMADKLFIGVKGSGAYLNEALIPRLSRYGSIEDILINVSAKNLMSFRENPINRIIGQRYIGSASLEICEIAMGATNAYISPRLNPWDVAAAVIILEEVGGVWQYGMRHNEIHLINDQAPMIGATDDAILNLVKSWI